MRAVARALSRAAVAAVLTAGGVVVVTGAAHAEEAPVESAAVGSPIVNPEQPLVPQERPTGGEGTVLGVLFTNQPAFAGISVAAPVPTGAQPAVVAAEQPPAAVLAGNLPRTGSDSRPLATVGVLLVLAGVGFLVPTLRRRRHT